MGLLDKADGGDAAPAKPAPKAAEPVTVAPLEAEPRRGRGRRAAEPEEAPEPRQPRPRRERPARAPREPRERADKSLSEDLELATKPARGARWLADLIVNWSLVILALVMVAFVDSGFLSTWLLLGGLILTIGNLFVLPIYTGMTVGHFVSRTRPVRYNGNTPLFTYHIMRGLSLPLIFFGLIALGSDIIVEMFGIDPDAGNVMLFKVLFMFMFMGLPIADYVVYRMRYETMQGLWDTAHNVYWVKYVPSGRSSGMFARLESLGNYAEARIAKMEARGEDGEDGEVMDVDDDASDNA